MSTQKTDPILTRLYRYRWACTSDISVVRLPPVHRKHQTARSSVHSLVRGRIWRAALLVALAICSIGFAAEGAHAATPYDDFLHKAPSLYVYTDSPANTQTMDVSGSWWSDYKQAYAKRVGIDGWPIDFVARFESMMSTGSWAVFIQENSDGTTISFFGTTDPNAYCDFSEPTVGAPTGMFGCTSHAGHDYATAEYFTHNSYGGNGCAGFVPPYNFCSDNGMNIYSHPVVGNAAADVRLWNRFVSGSLNFYVMNFDVQYPDGYAGEQVGTKPVPQSPSIPTAPAHQPAACPSLTVIGVRGSGEQSGTLGTPVGAFTSELKRLAKLRNQSDVEAVVTDYEAVKVGRSVLPWIKGSSVDLKYNRSVAGGVTSLVHTVRAEVEKPCSGARRIVLAGYSQGADVIGDAIENHSLDMFSSSIKAIMTWGDPMFNGIGDQFPSAYPNGSQPFFDPRSKSALGVFKPVWMSWCRRTDFFCQRGGNAASHSQYHKFEAQRGAAAVHNRLFGRKKGSLDVVTSASLEAGKVKVKCTTSVDATCLVKVVAAGTGDFGIERRTFWSHVRTSKTKGKKSSSGSATVVGIHARNGVEMDLETTGVAGNYKSKTFRISYSLRR